MPQHVAVAVARNPKTGEPVTVEGRSFPHFKPGKEMGERLNDAVLWSIHRRGLAQARSPG
jgi:hypothetical protein